VTGDAVISGGDIARVVLSFGLNSSSPLYDPLVDIDDKGVISGGDISFVVQRFGQIC
jgi:hypothetical protein